MCLYYQHLHTCGCLSRTQLDRCRAHILAKTPTPCCADTTTQNTYRSSHFPCYDCLRRTALEERATELETQMRAEQNEASQQNIRGALEKLNDKKAKSEIGERARKAARERAEKERLDEEERKRANAEEEERIKKEGGKWIDVANEKPKGRAGNGIPAKVATTAFSSGGGTQFKGPFSAPPVPGSGFGAAKMGLFGREVDAPAVRCNERLGDQSPRKKVADHGDANVGGSEGQGEGNGRRAPVGVDGEKTGEISTFKKTQETGNGNVHSGGGMARGGNANGRAKRSSWRK